MSHICQSNDDQITMTGNDATFSDLFDLAILGEETAEKIYRYFEKGFAHHPQVARFWKLYADEEAGHARYLRNLRSEIEPRRLDESVDGKVLQQAQKLRRRLVKEQLKEIHTLEDACRLASELENSEVNSLFTFIVTHFTPPERLKSQELLRSILNEHVNKLLELPVPYNSRLERQKIRILEQEG